MVNDMTSVPKLKNVTSRRQRMVCLLQNKGLTSIELRAQLKPVPSIRSLAKDLDWIRKSFPGRFHSERDGRPLRYFFSGDVPHLLPRPLAHLDADQLAALIAARGLLRTPDPASRSGSLSDSGDAYHGALAQALDRLLGASGLDADARTIAPDAVTISRFGVAPEEEAAFPLCLAAIRTNGSITGTYTNLDGEEHPVHAKAVRLVHVTGEWHLLAWSISREVGKLRQYRLSRMTGLQRRDDEPLGCPQSGLRREAANLLTDAFRATGSLKPADRVTVILAVSPKAWPFLERRRWGASQQWTNNPTDLPPGWRRLRFTTTGLAEARYWVLGFGTALRAEAPESLVQWIRDQAHELVIETSRTLQQNLHTKVVERNGP